MASSSAASVLPSPDPSPRRGVTWPDLLVVFALTVAVFAPVLRTGFAPLDDGLMLADNPDMRRPTWQTLKTFWTTAPWRIYMPLAETVWQGVALLSWEPAARGEARLLNPLGFKIVSLVAHALSAATAAWTLSRLTRTRWPALAGALVFALHPLQVESVAWTTGLKDLLCGLFACAAVGAYVGYARRDPAVPWRDGGWWAAWAMAVLAMLSKPTGMMVPVMLAGVDWAYRPTTRPTTLGRRFEALAPFALPAIGCALVIWAVQGGTPTGKIAAYLRPLVAADTVSFYLRKVVWPVPLSIDYGRRPAVVLASGAIWWTWLVPAVVLAGVAWARSRPLWLAAVLFVVPVVPVSGITSFDMQQYSTVTDHYAYQPLLGVALATALGLAALPRGWPRPTAVLATVLLAGFAGLTTRAACFEWENAERLYALMLDRNPGSWLARNLLARMAIGRGDLFTGHRLATRTLELTPGDGLALDAITIRDLLLADYPSAARVGREALKQTGLPRADTGKRMALLGAKLGDRDLAEAGVRHWLLAEPTNPYARDMLSAIVASKRQSAATRPASAR